MVALAGCSADLGGKCEAPGDCDDGQVCAEGYCLAADAGGVPTRDGEVASDGAPSPDPDGRVAIPDAATPDAATPDAAPARDAGAPDAAVRFCADPVPHEARAVPGAGPPGVVAGGNARTMALWLFDDGFDPLVAGGTPPPFASGSPSLDVKPVSGVEGCGIELRDEAGQRFELLSDLFGQPPFTASLWIRPLQGSRGEQAIVSSVIPGAPGLGLAGGWELGLDGGPASFTPYFEWAQLTAAGPQTVRARFPLTVRADVWSSVELFVADARLHLALDGQWSCVDVRVVGGAPRDVEIVPPAPGRQAIGHRPVVADQREGRLAAQLDEVHLLLGRDGPPPAAERCGEVTVLP